jgi:transcriptional regulator with XRE-family HTH domain
MASKPLHVASAEGEATRDRISAAIRDLLEHSDMTQTQLAEHLKLDPTVISRSLKVPSPRPRDWRASEIAQMAVLFHVPAGFFFGEDVEIEWLERVRRAREIYGTTHRTKLASLLTFGAIPPRSHEEP